MKKHFVPDYVPRANSVLAFLKSKGWTLDKKTHLFYVMNPPPEMQFSSKFQYFVPVNELGEDYMRYTKNLVDSISQLYQVDFNFLCEMLSVDVEEYKVEDEFRSYIRRELATAA